MSLLISHLWCKMDVGKVSDAPWKIKVMSLVFCLNNFTVICLKCKKSGIVVDSDSPPEPRGAAAPDWHSDDFWHPGPEVWISGLWHLRRCEPSLFPETHIFLPGCSQIKCSVNRCETFANVTLLWTHKDNVRQTKLTGMNSSVLPGRCGRVHLIPSHSRHHSGLRMEDSHLAWCTEWLQDSTGHSACRKL